MTIRSQVEVRAWNERLGHMENCSIKAPEGTYQFSKRFVNAFDEAFSNFHADLLTRMKEMGIKVSESDAFREIEALTYAMLVENNPHASSDFAISESFGEHVHNTSPGHSGKTVGQNVLEGAIRDRDFLRTMQKG